MLKTIKLKIADLKEAEYNPREATTEDMAGIRASLDEFGQVVPIVVNRHPKRMNVIVGGHQRVRAMREAGETDVVAVAVELKPREERDLNLRLNRTGEFDMERLMREFARDELEAAGFGKDELDSLGRSPEAGTDIEGSERAWSLALVFTDREEFREAREAYVGADKFERTLNLMRHYAEEKSRK